MAINNNLRNPTTEDVRNDVTAKAIKLKMDIITKVNNPGSHVTLVSMANSCRHLVSSFEMP